MTRRSVLAELLVITILSGVASAGAKSAGGNTGANPSSAQNSSGQSQGSQPQGSGSGNGPFESVMLAYGALDQSMQSLARRTCIVAQRANAAENQPLIVIIDQASLANLEAYDSFYNTARFLEISFSRMAGVATPAAAAGGVDTFADITNAVAAVLIASNTQTASTITIQDASAALKLSSYLTQDCGGNAEVVYPSIYGGDLTGIEGIFTALAAARQAALDNLPAPAAVANAPAPPEVAAFNNLDTSYNNFLQSWFAINSSTGQSGLAPIVQGYGLRQLLQSANRQIYEVYVNVAAAGGTQRVIKNAITALLTGDWVSYSGGVVVNTMILRKSAPSALLYSNVLRYRTPFTTIKHPLNKNSTHYGDNLGDTCPSGDTGCVAALSRQ